MKHADSMSAISILRVKTFYEENMNDIYMQKAITMKLAVACGFQGVSSWLLRCY